ncbi:MAG: hypothetical protein FWD87_05515 [Spirochaetaceae bacterium]|nr:hypothetical protein [Spirochaetaceae bacterium]
MKINSQNIYEEELGKLLNSSPIFDFFSTNHDDCKNHEIIDLVKKELYPLPVVDNELVIWGFHIINAASKAGMKNLLCRNINSKNLTKEEKLLIALQCENRCSNYSWDEKEKIYLFIVKELEGKVSNSVLLLVEQGGVFLNTASLYNSFSPVLKTFVKKGIIDLKTAKNCSNIPENSLELLEPYLLTLSFSNRRIILTNISEIIKKGVLDNDKSFSLVKGLLKEEIPFEAVIIIRYPELSLCREKFDQFNSIVLKDSGIKLKHPPYFEGSSYSAEFSFRSKKHLEKIIKRLSDLKEKSDEIFELL